MVTGIYSLHRGADDSGLDNTRLLCWTNNVSTIIYHIVENFQGRKLLQIWRI